MIDRNITEWLFYKSKYKRSIGANEWDDHKWIDLHFPNEEVFCKQILESSLDDFVKVLIWVFKDRYPIEFSGLETSMYGLDEEGIPFHEDVNTRKLQDIKPMIVEADDFQGIQHVSISFKKEQSNVFLWIEEELEDKQYTKEENELRVYNLTDSPIDRIEVAENGFTIYVNQDKVIY